MDVLGNDTPEHLELSDSVRKSLLQDLQEAAEVTIAGPCSTKSTPVSRRV